MDIDGDADMPEISAWIQATLRDFSRFFRLLLPALRFGPFTDPLLHLACGYRIY